ncbi:MAG TPA: type I methionyl aminopeptidase [Candidatus Hydrogenedentes bacterium]|nr:type I methionyl aminopeptidase [Candidatus Hydrogenedentota bacterium]HOL77757.1 type I methionyl aminopeptidase [Candidatus Hydrogenedentota bacterium]HPO86429.1 type I methionyl aminopeptidase [Candidatus Hydrogenedentota bacterium]
MIALRTEKEISFLRKANEITAEVLVALAGMIEPGIRTKDLDVAAAKIIRKAGGIPAFLGYRDYPACTCISVDEVIVHGIPNDRRLREGQIVSIDVGVKWKGYYGDAALTVPCGEIDELRRRLMETTDRALAAGIAAAVPGNYVSDISRAVQQCCESQGFSVVRAFVGHGIGTRLHEEPQIPNYDVGSRGPMLRPGMVLAIEPMVNAGIYEVRVLDDGWTAVTADGKPSAHFEHSVVIREQGAEILSLSPKRVWGM